MNFRWGYFQNDRMLIEGCPLLYGAVSGRGLATFLYFVDCGGGVGIAGEVGRLKV